MGFGVGTLVSSAQKRGCFQRGSLTQGPRDQMERNANTREKNTCWEYQHSAWKLKSPTHSRYGTGKTQA